MVSLIAAAASSIHSTRLAPARGVFLPPNPRMVSVLRSHLSLRTLQPPPPPPCPRKESNCQHLLTVGSGSARFLHSGFLDTVGDRVVWRRWRCNRLDYEGSDDEALLEEVREFIRTSGKQGGFPTRKEFVEGGRRDLMEAIKRRGGWMALGWSDDDGQKEKGVEISDAIKKWKSIYAGKGQDACKDSPGGSQVVADSSSSDGDTLPLASSSGISLGITEEEVDEIDDILNQLERRRILSLSRGTDCSNVEKDLRKGSLGDVGNSIEPDAWRRWINQRAGYSDREFEAAEINYDQSRKVTMQNTSVNEVVAPKKNAKELNVRGQSPGGDQIISRLKDLKLELSSTLNSISLNADELSQKVSSLGCRKCTAQPIDLHECLHRILKVHLIT